MKTCSYLTIMVAWLLPTFLFGQPVSIGDILCTDGSTVSVETFPTSGKTAEGIVFYIDETDAHGWAVSLHNQSTSIKWSVYYEYDVPNLPNISNARNAMHDLDGYSNTGIIRAEGGSNTFPAAWAVDYGNGWYLPSAGQLRYLYSYTPEVNASLQVVGGTLFPLENQYYWWSSTEFSPYHAYDMNNGGSLGDYLKDNSNNYPQTGIAVRQIRDFDIQNAAHPTYHIGDLITNDDGSQGILFYLSPDQSEGWMVALDDASTSISWGNGDVPGLDNQTCSAPYGLLLNETDGHTNTGIIRGYQNGMNTAANAVDYEHGWYLPTAGQLSKLFGALPFIEDRLEALGNTLADAEYWSSSEANGDEAFTLKCNPSGNVRAGNFLRRDKLSTYRVRAVRNLSASPPPTVGEIAAPDPICANEAIALQAPETQNATAEGWQLSPNLDFDNPLPYDGGPLGSDFNGWFLRYFATNHLETVYSNAVSILVWPTYETSFNIMACTQYVWNGSSYEESGYYEQHLTSIHGCDSIVTLHLTIADVVTNEWTQQTCEDVEWNGIIYSEPGDYEQNFTTPEGCDSTVILHLVSGPQPAAIPEIEGLTAVFVATDMILGQYFYSIDSVPLATHYEWLLDGADWPMDTTGTQCGLWITSAGTATLTVRAWNDCGYSEQSIIIHAGFFDVYEHSGIPFNLYPNPAKDKIVIEAEGIERVKIYNILGQCLIDKLVPKTPIAELSLPKLEPAPYIVEIQTIFGTSRTKIIIEKQ